MKDREQWLVFYSGDTQEVEMVEKATETLPQVDLQVVTESPLLKGFILLPMVEVPDGQRFHGMRSIEKLVDRTTSDISPKTAPSLTL